MTNETTSRLAALRAGIVLALLLTAGATPQFAAINQATGDIAGDTNALLSSNQVNLSAVQLALTKQARNLGGTVLATNADVVPGQAIYFVLIVDNTTLFPAIDIQLTDLLDETQFTYVATSLEETTVASGSSDAVIWAATWNAVTDTVSGADEASATDTGGPATLDRITVGAVPGQVNQSLTIAGSTLRAFRFRVTVN